MLYLLITGGLLFLGMTSLSISRSTEKDMRVVTDKPIFSDSAGSRNTKMDNKDKHIVGKMMLNIKYIGTRCKASSNQTVGYKFFLTAVPTEVDIISQSADFLSKDVSTDAFGGMVKLTRFTLYIQFINSTRHL